MDLHVDYVYNKPVFKQGLTSTTKDLYIYYIVQLLFLSTIFTNHSYCARVYSIADLSELEWLQKLQNVELFPGYQVHHMLIAYVKWWDRGKTFQE